VAVKPQKSDKRGAKVPTGIPEGKEPQFDHKTDRLSLLSGLLTDWYGEHTVTTGQRAVSSGKEGQIAGAKAAAAKGRQ
jgi:hypothetical protein